MKIRPARHRDLPGIRSLLAEAALPDDDVGVYLATLLVGEQNRAIIAAGALEPLGDTALLRSVVVAPQFRGRGLGLRMTRRLLENARRLGIGDVYLLTTTAPAFFAALGFEQLPREAAPELVRGTRQFADLCPATAVLMYLHFRTEEGEQPDRAPARPASPAPAS